MGKRRFKTIKLLFKLILLFQIYSHHKFEVEAAQNSISKSCDECDGASGLNNPISENKAVDNVLDRPKRPARLIPLKMLRYNLIEISNLVYCRVVLINFICELIYPGEKRKTKPISMTWQISVFTVLPQAVKNCRSWVTREMGFTWSKVKPRRTTSTLK